jgi:glycogen(starch) synthase
MEIILDRNLNICIVSREYPPDTLWGGIGTFTYNLAQGLKAIGHNVDVICFALVDESCTDDNGVIIHRIASPKVPFSNKTWWDQMHRAISPFALLYSLKIRNKLNDLNKDKNFDVVDFPEHIGEGFFSVLENKIPSLVRLYTPLSMISLLGLNKTTNSLDNFLFGILEKWSIKKATIVNSPSESLANLVNKKFNINKNVELIYNPIDTNRFRPCQEKNKKNDTVRLLFIGGFTDRKGVHILAQAIPLIVKELDFVEFTIIGSDSAGIDGFSSMKDYMLDIFKRESVLDRVTISGFVPYETLPNVYRTADISVVPSLYDNSPYACLEAMACGLPVIGTSAGGMPEYIDDGVSGVIISPGDVSALVGAIISLAEDKIKMKEYGSKARKKALNKFNREIVAKSITSLYQDAIFNFNLK